MEWLVVSMQSQPLNSTIDFLGVAFSNPKVAVAVLIQFLLGMGLGYYAVKIIKYVAAFIGVIVLGALLNVWSLGGSIEDFLTGITGNIGEVKTVVAGIVKTLGVLTVGPVSAGFVIGLLVGLLRK
ncbi:MAG: hypothetical protein F7C07_03455 [Desulfurococcales archaeon]|nr:hypothetical protein [Desulfurococcales archaeon]